MIYEDNQQFLDDNGDPLASGTVGFYVDGDTTTLRTVWTTAARDTAATNPQTLDTEGRLTQAIHGAIGGTYSVVKKTAAAAIVATTNGVPDVSGGNIYNPMTYGAVGDGTTDDTTAVAAMFAAVDAITSAQTSFNDAYLRPKITIDLQGKFFAVASTVGLGDGNVTGGYGGAIVIQNGAFIALSGFTSSTAVLRLTSSDSVDWTQDITCRDVIVDCNSNADYGIQVRKCSGVRIHSCYVTRYNTYGVIGTNSCFGTDVESCIIEGKPFVGGVEASPPTAGVYFEGPDCIVRNSIIRENLYGVQLHNTGKQRVYSNHMFANKYALYQSGTTQFCQVHDNYFEDPMLSNVGFRDSVISGNFFSESVKGGCLISLDDGSGHYRGCVISGNYANAESGIVDASYLATGTTTLALSAVTVGTARTATLTSGTWMQYNTDSGNTHVMDGGMIIEDSSQGRGRAIITAVTGDTTATVQIVTAFTGGAPATDIGTLDTGWAYQSAFLAPMTDGAGNDSTALGVNQDVFINNNVSPSREYTTDQTLREVDIATGTINIGRFNRLTQIDSADGAVTATLGSGPDHGFIKTVIMTEASTASTLTVTSHAERDGIVYEMGTDGAYVMLEWDETNGKWMTVRTALLTTESFGAAATVNVKGHNVLTITGNTNIGTLTMNPGQTCLLRFTGTPDVLDESDGSGDNIKLSGGANFSTIAADSTLTVFSPDGTTVYEVSRSVN